jgi:hypothetical protein
MSPRAREMPAGLSLPLRGQAIAHGAESPSYPEVFLLLEIQTADVAWADFCSFFNRIVHFFGPTLVSCAEGTFRHLPDLIARGRSAVTIRRSDREGQALPQKRSDERPWRCGCKTLRLLAMSFDLFA